jgi:hypothetical protein
MLLLATPAQAEITPDDLLLAARCIGAVDLELAGSKHIRADPGRAANIDYAFSELLTLPISPLAADMITARKRGRLDAEISPDAFDSVKAIMAEVAVSAECVTVIDNLVLLPVIYPQCFPQGCPPRP